MPDADGPLDASEAHELERDRDRWRSRGLDAERRYRERELALRRLREEVDDLRRDRDAWRDQANRLAAAVDERADPRPGRDRVRAAASRTIRAAWDVMPEPGRRLARPLVRRVRTRIPPSPTPSPADAPLPDPALVVTGAPTGEPGMAATAARTGAGEGRPLGSVSVIIPTLNGGPIFERTVAAIRGQDGIADLELLVADSGSTDGTVEVARSYGAHVVEVPAGEFSHGGTRDRVAELARGDVLVMTVQDAVLAGKQVLHSLVRHLASDPLLAAVSARQVPRLDCDLFGAFIMFTHARATLTVPTGGETAWFPSLTVPERRALCSVDNVCAAIRREAWESLRFRDVAFAEDLDFGLRAVEQGWRIATAIDVAVVHSHRRSARYHLGRFLVDRLTVAAFLGDPDRSAASLGGLEIVAASAGELLWALEDARSRAQDDPASLGFRSYLEAVAGRLANGAGRAAPAGELEEIAGLLSAGGGEADPATTELLRDGVLDLLTSPVLKEFGQRHPYVDRPEAEDFVGKAAALVVGAVLGDAMRDDVPETTLAKRLRQGI